MNAPKWVSQDVPLYKALLSDIFPGLTNFKPPKDWFESRSRLKAELCKRSHPHAHTCKSRTACTYHTMQYYCYDIYTLILAAKIISCDMMQHVRCVYSKSTMFAILIYAVDVAGVELPVPDYGKLEEVIRQVLDEMGCQKVQHSVDKCISIYETRMNGM